MASTAASHTMHSVMRYMIKICNGLNRCCFFQDNAKVLGMSPEEGSYLVALIGK
jgi:hypothetical protein